MRFVAPIRMKSWQLIAYGVGLLVLASLFGTGGLGIFVAALTLGDLREGGPRT